MTNGPRFPKTAIRGAGGEQEAATLTQTQRILHLLSRFSLGTTPELVAEVRAVGIRDWLDRQLASDTGRGPEVESRLGRLESIDLTSREILDRYVLPTPEGATREERRNIQRLRNVPPRELKERVLLHAVYSRNQVQEAAADFFRNHFCVAIDKGLVKYFAIEYERDVIHGRVFGPFGDMLQASAKHPAMLVHLDNALSRRAPTKAELKEIELRVRQKTKSKQAGREASDIAAQRGLNENYAREMLELHTLGVDNYYTQRDVESVARVLTGWTVRNEPDRPIEFEFRPEMHDKGDKKFLHALIKDDWKKPQSEGEKVLDILGGHKGTAHFISWKICRHFVSDDPPEDMVGRIATAFRRTGGDLPSLYGAVVDDPEFFAPRHYRSKFKRPFEFVVSALRATGAAIEDSRGILAALGAMNEPLYECADPTGYYDQAEAWLDPGAFAVRWKFARDLVAGKIDGVRIPDSFYEELPADRPDRWRESLVSRLLPSGLDARVSRLLDEKVRAHVESGGSRDREELPRTMVETILGSPDFQRQ